MPSSDPLRIALFTYSTQPRGGVLHALALGDALHAAGHDVLLHALDEGGAGFVRTPRCPYRLIAVPPAGGEPLPAFVARRVAAYVAAWDAAAPAFDIYHAHDGISGNALASLTARGALDGFVRTVHHVDTFADPEMRALQDRAIVTASACLVVSETWRTFLAQTYGIPAVCVPNGVDARRFVALGSAERAELRVALGFGECPVFVTIGGIEARKNTLVTLEAFARVRDVLPRARLIVAGGASVLDHSAYRAAFMARAAELGCALGTDIVLTGVLQDAEIVALLQAADAFVFPSLVEGFGLVVLEALACGTPVVVSALAPFTEYLGSADALFVDPRDPVAVADALLRACDSTIAAALRECGRAVVARFSWEAAARAHVAAYRALGARREVAAHA